MAINFRKKLAPSHALAVKVVWNAMKLLKEKGGEAPGREIISELENRLDFNEWEKDVYEKTGNVRWKSILHFFSIDCVKAEFLLKKKGVWYLTPEGEQALLLGDIEFMQKANDKYNEWKKEHKKETKDDTTEELTEESEVVEATLDEIEQKAVSKTTARNAQVHLELIDLPRFISLWQYFLFLYPRRTLGQ